MTTKPTKPTKPTQPIRKVRIIEVKEIHRIKTNTTSKQFKQDFPNAKYNKKTKVYNLPPIIFKEQIQKPIKTQPRQKPSRQLRIQTEQIKRKKQPKQPKAKPKQEFIPQDRFRISVTLDMKHPSIDSGDSIPSNQGLTYASIKATALTTSDYNERGLKEIVDNIKARLEQQGYNFNNLNQNYGTEYPKLLDPSEEFILNDNQVHIHQILNGKVTKFTY